MQKCSIRCSVVGLAAEVRVCCALTKATGGTYNVIMDENHFKEILFQHAIPPPVTGNSESSLIRMVHVSPACPPSLTIMSTSVPSARHSSVWSVIFSFMTLYTHAQDVRVDPPRSKTRLDNKDI
ncbi:Bcl-2-associated transcription factor (BTF), putative [Ixodes scapularis]|uniref:Bcl-2-associated transcription factor (BTF), putative n=1 Tax=Ixodes scapularis TaxID=6945 RepID=B7PCD8_IXOSC|nr:Bcl-2-associated transcription factor (BTF), putative [Ixodes scapularis]|eukprot:XP_002409694.1 Bcl-2-associated transcription factor (BTF), putative [Ixodes scapularis]